MNTKADVLLRKDQVDMKEDNKDILILKIWTRRQITAEVTLIQKNQVVEEITLLEGIWKNNTKEQEVVKELEKNNNQAWEEDGIVYVEENIYVLNNWKIWEQILQENYNLVDVRHSGQQQMLKLIKKNYWWPEIKGDIKKYIQGCTKCQ